MRFFTLILLLTIMTSCQEKKAAQLHEAETPEVVEAEAKISVQDLVKKYDLFSGFIKVVYIEDQRGKSKLLLTAKEIDANQHAGRYDSLKAVHISDDGKELYWQMQDFVRREDSGFLNEEDEIVYLEDYISVMDLDQDGLADPIIVYATQSLNDWNDGRVKFLIYYKDRKSAVRQSKWRAGWRAVYEYR